MSASPPRLETLPSPLASRFPLRLWQTADAAERTGWVIALALWLAYILYFASLWSFPFQDYPNHLARAAIMADLLFHGGHLFGQDFTLHLAIVPYLFHDLLLTGLVALLGVIPGGFVFSTFVLVSMPLALLFYMRVNGLAPCGRLFVLIVSLYLATDWFFLMGFMAFRLALACVIVLAALTDMLRRRWSRSGYGWYAAVLLLGYLTHLTTLVFFAPVLTVSGIFRLILGRTTARTEAVLWIPLVVLFAVQFGLVAVAHDATHPAAFLYYWGTVHDKIRRLNWEFLRFDGRPSPLMIYTLVAGVLWAIRRDLHWRALLKPNVLENLLLALTFLGIYWVLPSAYQDSVYVDVRALCLVALFLLCAALYLPPAASRGAPFAERPVLAIALMLGCVNFAYLVLHFSKNETWMENYRKVIAAIPVGARVLTVYSSPAQMDIEPFRHAGSFATLDRAAITPYLFSGDRGDSMEYFSYRHRPYMPEESWYKSREYWNAATPATYQVEGQRYTWRFTWSRADHFWRAEELIPVDWNRVACDYQYVLIALPYDEQAIEVPTSVAAYNQTAALLAVDKRACHPGESPRQKVRLPLER